MTLKRHRRMSQRRTKREVTSPALLLAAAIGGIGIDRPDAAPRVKYADRERDTPRMLWTKTLRCCAHRLAELAGAAVLAIVGRCRGRVEADHAGAGAHTGMQRKSLDATCIPMCERHHRSPGLQHLAYGNLVKGTVQRFRDQMAVEYDALWIAHLARVA